MAPRRSRVRRPERSDRGIQALVPNTSAPGLPSSGTNRSDVYGYDLAGNRTSHVRDGASTSYQQNAGGDRERNQYTLIGGLAQAYDLNGNQTSREVSAGMTEGRVFDESNRLVQLLRQNKTTSYRYDATGRRISKDLDDNGTSSRATFFCDGARVVEEFGTGPAFEDRSYVYGPGVDEPMRRKGGSSGELFYGRNSIGSVTALSSRFGANRTEGYRYRPFGETTVLDSGGADITASTAGAGNEANAHRFQGRRFDHEEGSDLYYFRTRFLDPAIGRFISKDSIGDWGDPGNVGNGMTFCGNDPVNCVDPFGLDSIRPPTPQIRDVDVTIGNLAASSLEAANSTFWSVVNVASFGWLGGKSLKESQDRLGLRRGEREAQRISTTIAVVALSAAAGGGVGVQASKSLTASRTASLASLGATEAEIAAGSTTFASAALPYVTASGGALTELSFINLRRAKSHEDVGLAMAQYHAGLTLLFPGPGNFTSYNQWPPVRYQPTLRGATDAMEDHVNHLVELAKEKHISKNELGRIPTVVGAYNEREAIAVNVNRRVHTNGECAEDVAKALLGGEHGPVRFTRARRPRTGEEIRVCRRCQERHGYGAFPDPQTLFVGPGETSCRVKED